MDFRVLLIFCIVSSLSRAASSSAGQNPQASDYNADVSFSFDSARSDDVNTTSHDVLRQQRQFVHAFSSRFPTAVKIAEFLQDVAHDRNSGLSGTCMLHILDTFEAFIHEEIWAWKLFDSWGKPGPGMITLYPILRGEYDECRGVRSRRKSRPPPTQAKTPPPSSTYQVPQQSSSPAFNRKVIPYPHIPAKTIIPHGNTRSEKVLKDHNEENNDVYGMNIQNGGETFNHQQDKRFRDKREVTSENSIFPSLHSYLESVFADDDSDDPSAFKGKFCRVGVSTNAVPVDIIIVPVLNIYLGISVDVCIPDSCSANDARILVNKTVEAFLFDSNVGQFVAEKSFCQEELPWEGKTIGVIVFMVVSLAWLAFCTFYDIFYIQKPRWRLQELKEEFIAKRATLLKAADATESNGHVIINSSVVLTGEERARLLERERGRSEEDQGGNNGPGESLEEILFKEPTISSLAKTLQFFSVYTNGSKILNSELRPGTMECMHGIRFLSMCWIVLGHTLLVGLVDVGNAVEFMFEHRKKVLFLILANGFLCVDSFFVFSGVLVGYVFKDIVDNDSRLSLKVPVYILHRYFRLCPALVVFTAIYIGLWPHASTGPNYPAKAPDEDMCRETWMYTLFYINNFLPLEKLCLMWTWYLSCDYQFYLVCPIFMVPLCAGWRKTGLFLAVTMTIGTMITSGVLSYTYQMAEILPQLFRPDGELSDPRIYYNEFYQRPYCRMGPYIVGLLVGYAIKVTDRKINIPKPLVFLGWVSSTVVALTVLFGVHGSFANHRIMEPWEAAIYNAFKHTAFGLSVGWVLFACLTGHGSFVNVFLSWRGFIPLSRLTFCTYLVHPAVIYLFSYSFNNIVLLNMWSLILHWLGVLVISMILGFMLSLTVESPTIQVEKDILRRIGYV